MKASEIRDLQREEIDSQIEKVRAQLFKFGFHASNEDMQRAGEIRLLRRDLARLKTVQRERQMAQATTTTARIGAASAGPQEEADNGRS